MLKYEVYVYKYALHMKCIQGVSIEYKISESASYQGTSSLLKIYNKYSKLVNYVHGYILKSSTVASYILQKYFCPVYIHRFMAKTFSLFISISQLTQVL